MNNFTDGLHVTFNPTDYEFGEIEEWLKSEDRISGRGFYRKIGEISSSFSNNVLASIKHNDTTIGFACWRITSMKTARIEFAEVKPGWRRMGVGKKLVKELSKFLRGMDICIIDLQCAPSESEKSWKRIGFREFPDPLEIYHFSQGTNKELYMILMNHLGVGKIVASNDIIELWNLEKVQTDNGNTPKYRWNIEFREGSRQLKTPIIHPANYKWRLRWTSNGVVHYDNEIRYLKSDIEFDKFIIISELPSCMEERIEEL